MAAFKRDLIDHTAWCARDHRCGVAEHRSPDIIADGIGGRAWITRVRAGNVEYAEIRARIPLHRTETKARWQLATILRLMRELLAAVAIRPASLDGRGRRETIGSGRRAIGSGRREVA